MARRSTLRASDSDREQIAERLRHATAEGRLLAEELEERLTAALRARTYGELDQLVADLPDGRAVARRPSSALAHYVPRVFALVVVGLATLIVVAVALAVVAGLAVAWLVWAAVGWWVFGRHRRRAYYMYRYRRPRARGRSGYRPRYGTRRVF